MGALVAVVASLLLVGLVWALFGQSGKFEFLRLDDPTYTFNCTFVKDGLSWANVREAFANVRHGGIWMPATYISYMIGISAFGRRPVPANGKLLNNFRCQRHTSIVQNASSCAKRRFREDGGHGYAQYVTCKTREN